MDDYTIGKISNRHWSSTGTVRWWKLFFIITYMNNVCAFWAGAAVDRWMGYESDASVTVKWVTWNLRNNIHNCYCNRNLMELQYKLTWNSGCKREQASRDRIAEVVLYWRCIDHKRPCRSFYSDASAGRQWKPIDTTCNVVQTRPESKLVVKAFAAFGQAEMGRARVADWRESVAEYHPTYDSNLKLEYDPKSLSQHFAAAADHFHRPANPLVSIGQKAPHGLTKSFLPTLRQDPGAHPIAPADQGMWGMSHCQRTKLLDLKVRQNCCCPPPPLLLRVLLQPPPRSACEEKTGNNE